MNTNILKLFFGTLLVHTLCFSVVLSHMHAKDAISMSMQQAGSARLATSDITAKALGDLHHHIDKAGLKNIAAVSTAAGRTRELNPLNVDTADESLAARFHDFILRFRVVASLFYQLA